MNVVSARELTHRYGARTALDRCSFDIPAGSVTALIGPNGAGKTTLLHLIAGLLRPSSGSIEVLGADPRREPLAVLPHLGFVGQDHSLERSFTVAEMLTFGRRLNVRWNDDIARDALRTHDIPLDRKVGRLSGGQRSQVALALARAKEPDLLVLDEPVAALDPLARREFNAALMDAAASECTVLLSSHLVTDLERVCDHVVLVRNGRVRLAAGIEETLSTHHLLVGPRDALPSLGATSKIIDQSVSGRQATVLVHSLAPTFGQEWDILALSLEDLVLGYLGSREGIPEIAA